MDFLLAFLSVPATANTLPQESGKQPLNELSRDIDSAIEQVCASHSKSEGRDLFCRISRVMIIEEFANFCIETKNMSSSGECKNVSALEYSEWYKSKSDKIRKSYSSK